MERRYDIDWLRVIAIGLLLIYHIGIAFQPWGMMIGFIQSDEPLQGIWPAMTLLNIWRIPFLFFVSGMGVAFALRKRTIKALLLERGKRILLPFLFGMIAIVPIHLYFFQYYYDLPLSYVPHAGHLWFLGNIFAYVLLLWPIMYWSTQDNQFSKGLKKVFSSEWGLLVTILAMIGEVLLVKPAIFELYAQTWHGFFIGMVAFLFGYFFIVAGEPFWKRLTKWRFLFLIGAISLYVFRLTTYQLKSPGPLMSLESNLWIFSILSFGRLYLDKPGKVLDYLSKGAYPIYILHMIFLCLGSVVLFKTTIAPELQLVLLTLITFAGCFLSYELIRRIKYVRLLFGLK
ncbi:acyltransferase family protein [Marinoscillum sp.]|uniref:acyltransferase family protein n=1 Tax=Marinoscillum sp. TaxID=2024838 RepID=UPI003BAA1E75